MSHNQLFKSLGSSISRYNIASFDIETYGNKNKFLMGSMIYDFRKGEIGQNIFWNKKEFQEFILNKYFSGYKIFATNLMFDFFALFDKWENMNFKPLIRHGIMINSKFGIEEGENNRRIITFFDTLALSKLSVEDIGDIIGIKKMDKPLFLGEKKELTPEEKVELVNYNLNDSMITFKFAKFLQNNFNNIGCSLKSTISSTSMDLYRKKYFNNFMPIIQHDKEIRDYIRLGYYGGRVEALKRGRVENLNYYDINSLYPFVMLNEIPNPNSLKHEHERHKQIDNINNYNGFTKCKLETPNINIPLLPVKNKKLFFPIGKLNGVYSHVELRKALEIGYKLKDIDKQIYYTENECYFKEFVLDLYKKRMMYKDAKNPMEHVYKIILNSLYGKFAQREENELLIPKNHPDFMKYWNSEEEVEFLKEKLLVVTEKNPQKIPSFIIPEVSATITSYARLELFNYLEKYPEQIFYYDTDSMITSKSLNTSTELGGLKLECKIKEGIIIKPKSYLINDEVKFKGVPISHKKNNDSIIKNKDIFNKILNEEDIKFVKFAKLKECLRSKKDLDVNEKIDISKKINLNDSKRFWFEKFNPKELQTSVPILI